MTSGPFRPLACTRSRFLAVQYTRLTATDRSQIRPRRTLTAGAPGLSNRASRARAAEGLGLAAPESRLRGMIFNNHSGLDSPASVHTSTSTLTAHAIVYPSACDLMCACRVCVAWREAASLHTLYLSEATSTSLHVRLGRMCVLDCVGRVVSRLVDTFRYTNNRQGKPDLTCTSDLHVL